MEEQSNIQFGAIQGYSRFMEPYFNPFVVVASVIAKMDINPTLIKEFDVRFINDDDITMNEYVRIKVILNMPMSESWIEHMKEHLSRLLKDAFLTSYGKNTKEWYSHYEKEPPAWS